MGKAKKIPEKYIDRIIENNKNALVLSSEYENEDSILTIYCEKHNVKYQHALKNAVRANGCPECKRDKRLLITDEFKKEAFLNNPHIEILENYKHEDGHILCRCNIHNIEFSPHITSLINGRGGCPQCKADNIGNNKIPSEVIKQNFNKLNPTLSIIDDDVKLKTFVNVHCLVCGNNFKKKLTHPYVFKKKCGCSVCLNKIIIPGFNDVATTRPDLIKYFEDKSDAFKYGSGQTKVLNFVCPDCGYRKEMKIEVLARQGFSCPCCGDGISYPNKFIRSFIRQLNVSNIKFEYSPKWANRYFYDCYFEYNGKKIIIEVDGQQHFKKSSNFKMSLEEVQKRDEIKDKLALENNHWLIRIDARKSDKDYLCAQIFKSELSSLFDLKNINWEKCDIVASSNFAKEVCLYADKTMPEKYKYICDRFDISENTVRKYLKQGVEYGWCSNNVIEKLAVPKRVVVCDKDENPLYIFNGIKKCSELISKMCDDDYDIRKITSNCHHDINSYKNYIFKFAYELDQSVLKELI